MPRNAQSMAIPKRQRRRGRWPGRVLLVLMIAAVAPLAFDGLKVCVSNWMAMHHRYWNVDTPAFDFVVRAKHEIVAQSWQLVGPLVHEPPWKAGATITFAGVWAVVVAWMFRSR